jgi:hypothetical protein
VGYCAAHVVHVCSTGACSEERFVVQLRTSGGVVAALCIEG